MTATQSLLAFIAAASILTITPGVDTAIVLRSATAAGPRAAAYASIGIALGCFVWGIAISLGLGALIAASEIAFSIVRWAGAAYLLWLGCTLILHPREAINTGSSGLAESDRYTSLKQGFLTNLLNPKVGVFYITFLPQFIPVGASVAAFSLILVAVHVVLGLAWFAMLIVATVPLGRLLQRPRVIKAMDRVTGGLFISFGVKLALSK